MRTLLNTKPLTRFKVKLRDSGPSSLYLFNEVGNIIKDEVGGWDHILANSSPAGSWVLGPEGLEYSHNLDYFEQAPCDPALGSYPWSVVYRCRTTIGIAQVVWSIGAGSYYWRIRITAGGQIYCQWSTSIGSGEMRFSGDPMVDELNHTIVLTVNSSTNRALYFDGELASTQTSGDSGVFSPSTSRFGAVATTLPGTYFRGWSQLCAVYSDRAITAEEVALLG